MAGLSPQEQAHVDEVHRKLAAGEELDDNERATAGYIGFAVFKMLAREELTEAELTPSERAALALAD